MDLTDKPYRHGVNIIIIDQDDKFLIVQKNGYKDNAWSFVGGGKEEGESLDQNMYRELKEELSLNKEDFEQIGISTHKIEYDYPAEVAARVNGGKYRGQSYNQVVLRFIGDKSKIKFLADEFKNHRWIDGKKLIKHLIFPNQYQNYKSAIDELLPGLI